MRRWIVTVLVLLFSVSLHGAAKVPYGIDKRPMPRGEDPNVLAPAAVGEFKRPAFPKARRRLLTRI